MLEIAPGWQLDVDRGPDWLFVRIHDPAEAHDDAPPLADRLWELLQEQFVNRLIIELDELRWLPSYLIGQLVLIQKKVHTHGGVVRLCGLSPDNERVLRLTRLDSLLPNYANRAAAVMGHVPQKPR